MRSLVIGRGRAGAHILAWMVIALVNAVVILTTTRRPPSFGVRLLHVGYDFGQCLAMGLLAATAVWLFTRYVPRPRRFGLVAIAVVAFALGLHVLADDISVAAGRFPDAVPRPLAEASLVALITAPVTVAAFLAGGARAWWFRLALAGFGLAVAVANDRVLIGDYPGVHFFGAWTSALLLAGGIAAPDATPAPGRVAQRLVAVAAVVAAAAVLVPPSNVVALELYKIPGTVLAPLLAELRSDEEASGAGVRSNDQWFKSRRDQPLVLPSKPSVLPKDPVVLLLTVDCFRADLLERPELAARLPTLKKLRDESTFFSQARTVAPSTLQAMAALFTSRYFSSLYWTRDPKLHKRYFYPHLDDTPRFSELLARAGVKTVNIQGLPGIVNATGLVKGFAEERVVRGHGDFAGVREMMPQIIARVRAHDKGKLFLFAHFADPHAPYDRGGRKSTPFESYFAEVELVDQGMKQLLAALEDAGLSQRTVIVFGADHGEAFLEHGTRYHATTLYDELLRIPLIVHVPGQPPRVVDAPASLVDIGPTLLDLFGKPTPGVYMGQSLLPYVRGKDTILSRPVAFESARGLRGMLFRDKLKLIVDIKKHTKQIYDLRTDPREQNNRYGELGALSTERLRVMNQFFEAHRFRKDGYEIPWGR